MRRIRFVAIALGLLVLAQARPLFAQATGRIRGHVTDATPQKHPIEGATVVIVGTSFWGRTDIQGAYTIENIPAGTVQVRAGMNGYRLHEIPGLRIPAGQTIMGLDFMLEANMAARIEMPAGGLLLRFQLIKATPTRSVDPAIAGIDSVLKDLFRFPGYRLLSSTAVALDYMPSPRSPYGTSSEQLLSGEGKTYRLLVRVDTASAAMVRMNVSLYEPITPVVTKNSSGGASVGSDRYTLLNTTVSVAYGRTVVLGSTQPARPGQPGTPAGTLILTVKPDLRTP